MQRAYIETSIINRACDELINGQGLANFLKQMSYSPAIGMHVIYELARTFLDQSYAQRGQSLFSLIKDINPAIIPLTQDLHEMEIIKLRTGAAVLPFLDAINEVATHYEIEKLSNGIFDSRAEQFIRSREQKVMEIEPIFTQKYLNHVKKVKASNPKLSRQMRTFKDVLSYFENDIPQLIRDILRVRITKYEAYELSQRLQSFPAIRSAVFANLYIAFILIVYQTPPSYDKPDDYRHIIDSSYSSIVISADSSLCRAIKWINPDIRVLTWEEIRINI